MSERTPLLFGAVSDDLTGGSELASMLIARGVPTGFSVGSGTALAPDAPAHVTALKTRVAPPGEAVAQVVEAVERLIAAGAKQIFFKYCATFDSTPAGNIGPCAEALADRLGAPFALFCPALCETGRTVFQGHMFGGSQLLAESPKRFDPLTPMKDSNLVRVLAGQSRRRVGLVSHASVDRGPDAIVARCRELAADGVGFALADTIYERDLATLARAAVDHPLFTGNSSVAAHLPPVWRERGLLSEALRPAPLAGIDGPAAVLAGSVAPKTAEQLARFGASNPLLTLDLARAFAGHDVAAEAIDWAGRHLASGAQVAIATTVPQHAVEALQATYGRDEAARKAEVLLARVAMALVREFGVRRLIVAGGETAGAIVRALGVERFEVGPYEGPGVSRLVARLPFPVALMLKSGKLGGPDIFAEVLDAMRRPLEANAAGDPWPPVRRSAHP